MEAAKDLSGLVSMVFDTIEHGAIKNVKSHGGRVLLLDIE